MRKFYYVGRHIATAYLTVWDRDHNLDRIGKVRRKTGLIPRRYSRENRREIAKAEWVATLTTGEEGRGKTRNAAVCDAYKNAGKPEMCEETP